MQNSIQWFNLYSTESKFSINVYKSSVKWLLIFSCAFLLLVGLLALSFFESTPVLVLSLFIGVVVLLCLSISIIATKQSSNINAKPVIPFISFGLTVNGEVLLSSGEEYHLHSSSRHGLFGCWLVLIANDKDTPYRKSLFIFKDSVSAKDYARLCRTITRNNLKITEGVIS